MRRFSAQYVITNSGPTLKRAIITTDDEGTVLNVEDTMGVLKESDSVEFYNGIIIPGFVNSHCHLELSHMKDKTIRSQGLSSFLDDIGKKRAGDEETILNAAQVADAEMFSSGINLCADISNSSATFGIKNASRIAYINFLEVFGIDPDKASKRIGDITRVAEKAEEAGLPYWFVPHTVYSVSVPLFRLLRDISKNNKVTSLHFMEARAEKELVENHSGPLMKYYIESGFLTGELNVPKSHIDAVLNEITPEGNLILVHNTFITVDLLEALVQRGNLFWCLCPASNLYIENQLPPVELLREHGCTITLGTDSLASNDNLDIMTELKLLQSAFPAIALDEMIMWATLNGARALCMENKFGSLGKGKQPGLLLIENADLVNFRLTPESYVTRLL
jgi:aminodeoxyfutalosine deaminase